MRIRHRPSKHTLMAAQGGYVPAQEVAGMAYAVGKGVQRNYREAGKWFRIAAEAGNPRAAINKRGFVKLISFAADSADHVSTKHVTVGVDVVGLRGRREWK
jgi:hypothetical protein